MSFAFFFFFLIPLQLSFINDFSFDLGDCVQISVSFKRFIFFFKSESLALEALFPEEYCVCV